MKTFLRILIIGAIILILIFLSIAVVRIVPKVVSSLASASVSISSLFGGNNATSTATTTPEYNGGFIVATSTKTSTSTDRSLKDILMPHTGDYPPNNYVPRPGTDTSTLDSRGVYRSTTQSNPRTCEANEYPDLVVSILSRGIISKNTGVYVETNTFTTTDTVSIKFKIENRGNCSSGTWNIFTQLPSSNSVDRVRNVTNVAPLPAGSAVTGVANFDSPQAGNVAATFTVSDNSGKDAYPTNNVATVNFSVANNGTIGGGSVGTIGDGRPDLTVRVLRTGILDYNNNFITTGNTTFRSTDRVAIQFEVINQGRSPSGTWNFQANLSGNFPGRLYSNPQYEASIPSGGKSTFTMAFDSIGYGNNTITIFVDNMYQVNEVIESNNTASVNFYTSY